MGAVSFSIDPGLLEVLAQNLQLDLFVETGTFEGASVDCAKNYFSEIYSVELSPEYYQNARDKFLPQSHINIVQGDGATALKALRPVFNGRSIVFWLDAHWCVASNTAGEHSQCHLADEIEAIGALNDDSIVLIDDARFFLAPPPYPHVFDQWPDLSAIIRKLQALSDRHEFRVINDVILFFPVRLSEAINDYGYRHGVDWLSIYQKSTALDVCEADRAARLVVINDLSGRLMEWEDKYRASFSLHFKIKRLGRAVKNIFIKS